MSTEQYKTAIRRFVQQGFNQQDFAEYDVFYGTELTDHGLPPNMPSGLEGRKMFMSAFFAAFPDLLATIEDIIASDDRAALRWSATGTHTGELMGIPPTSKSVTVTGIVIYRFEGGKAVEHWEVFDQMGMMQQLGVIPS